MYCKLSCAEHEANQIEVNWAIKGHVVPSEYELVPIFQLLSNSTRTVAKNLEYQLGRSRRYQEPSGEARAVPPPGEICISDNLCSLKMIGLYLGLFWQF